MSESKNKRLRALHEELSQMADVFKFLALEIENKFLSKEEILKDEQNQD